MKDMRPSAISKEGWGLVVDGAGYAISTETI